MPTRDYGQAEFLHVFGFGRACRFSAQGGACRGAPCRTVPGALASLPGVRSFGRNDDRRVCYPWRIRIRRQRRSRCRAAGQGGAMHGKARSARPQPTSLKPGFRVEGRMRQAHRRAKTTGAPIGKLHLGSDRQMRIRALRRNSPVNCRKTCPWKERRTLWWCRRPTLCEPVKRSVRRQRVRVSPSWCGGDRAFNARPVPDRLR